MNVGIVSNSPGEVAGWAIPASKILKKLGFKIDLYLTPCMFASKREFDVALKFGQFSQIFNSYETLKKIFFQNKNKYDLFIHMGGDIWYSTKFKSDKLFSYGWGTKRLDKFFQYYLVPNQYYLRKLIERKIDNSKIVKVRDLVFEKFFEKFEESNYYNPDSNLLGFMLGSRKNEFYGLLDLYLRTIKLIDRKFEFVFFVSPFIYDLFENKESFEREVLDFIKNYGFNGFKNLRFIVDEEEKIELLSNLRLLITIPGTKTNEAGYLGIPQLVILPLQKPEEIPIWGAIGWLDFLGKMGKKIKGYFVLKYAQKNILSNKRFIAMPNIIAQKKIVEEFVEIINEHNLSEKINQLLENKQRLISISNELKQIYRAWEDDAITFQDAIKKLVFNQI